ncbi:hypothetical protein ABT093_09640 [Kitasatospora sp. NPDC002551]|uniref:hypothetical protein n=1 Tax=Kitasatospora sp. NPDC002551 TaxID=3154539 RepID=UPI003324E6B1
MWRGTLTPGRVLDLLAELPPGSRFAAARLGDPSAVGWDAKTHLLADIVEAIHTLTWVTMQVRTRKRLEVPAHLPRPGTARSRPSAERRPLDLSKHPNARPLPEKYRTHN